MRACVCVMTFKQDLIDALKSELRSDLKDTVEALMTPPRLYDAQQLRAAMRVGHPTPSRRSDIASITDCVLS